MVQNFKGIFSGLTTDKEFDEITEFLAKFGKVVSEEESNTGDFEIPRITDLVVTKYQVGEEFYELWYQVYTPASPKDMNCTFGFRYIEAKEAKPLK